METNLRTHSHRPRGLPWECYGNALHYHRVTWNSIGSTKCLRTLGLEPCRCYGKAMVYHSGEDQSLGNCLDFAWMLLIVKYIEHILGMA